MRNRVPLIILAWLLAVVPAAAQISVPYTFTAGTVANPDEVNSNFAKFADALNRTGGTMTGTLTARAIAAVATNTYDIGATATRFKDGWFAGTVTTATLTASGTITGGAFSGPGTGLTNVAILNASNTFSAANPIVLGSANNGTLRTDNASLFTMQGGTSGFDWHNNANSTSLMTLSNAGALALTAALNGFQSVVSTNTTSGTGAGSLLRVVAGTTIGQLVATSQGYTTGSFDIQASTYLSSAGAGGLSLVTTDAAGVIRLYTNSTLRWGVNAAGDHTFGASSHISDSSGTPGAASNACGGGGCATSIAGTDYAMKLTFTGPSSTTSATVTFGHTWSTAPVCVGTSDPGTPAALSISGITTTQFVIGSAFPSGVSVGVLCRGY